VKPSTLVTSIALIVIGVLALGYGVLMFLASTSQLATQAQTASRSTQGWIGCVLAFLLLGGGIAILWIAYKKRDQKIEVVQKVDLSGEIDLATLKCRNCGAALDKSAVKVVAGAVMVTCPYCGTSYQIEEKPMW
jgi:hypothetical protein